MEPPAGDVGEVERVKVLRQVLRMASNSARLRSPALRHGAYSPQVRNALLPEQAEARAANAKKRRAIEANFQNLAHEVATGAQTVEEPRKQYAQSPQMLMKQNQKDST